MKQYLPSGCSIEVKLIRSNPEFALEFPSTSKTGVSGCPYSFGIQECNLVIKAFTVNEQILKHHQSLFSRDSKAQYPIRTTQVRGIQIPTGCMTFYTDVLWSNRLPLFAIFGLIESTRFNGAFNKHPFNFVPNGLSSILLKVDQENLICKSLPVQYNSNLYQLAFDTLSDAVGENSPGNSISRDNYTKGFTFYIFHLLPVSAGVEFQPQRVGTMRAELQFETATTSPLHLVECSRV